VENRETGSNASNETVLVGDDVILKCTVSVPTPVDWLYFPSSPGVNRQYLVSAGVLVETTHQRYALIKNSMGSFDFMIHNAQLNDNGWYECIEDSGTGEILQLVFLNVLKGKSDFSSLSSSYMTCVL
jgi:hypothetical protein